MATNTAIGMMDPAYFVGRNEILNWLNDLCKLNLSKIEETANGAVACQVMDALFNCVPMQKVNWGARGDYEFVQNYKLLQMVCNKMKIDRKIEVEKLTRARYQDNLEFMQWLKKFFELNYSENVEHYDAVSRRSKGKNVNLYKPAASGQGKKLPTAKTSGAGNNIRQGRKPGVARSAVTKEKENATKNVSKPSSKRASKEAPTGDQRRSSSSPSAPAAPNPQHTAALNNLTEELTQLREDHSKLQTQFQELKTENAEIKIELEGNMRERDFYFNKLREIEILLQEYEGNDEKYKDSIFQILYAAEDDEDDEEVVDPDTPVESDNVQEDQQQHEEALEVKHEDEDLAESDVPETAGDEYDGEGKAGAESD